jgi:hypothetical protein
VPASAGTSSCKWRGSANSTGSITAPRKKPASCVSSQEGLKQIFFSASEHSSLIIEYVQRFGDFHGFFTKENVAGLTAAAGADETLRSLENAARRG